MERTATASCTLNRATDSRSFLPPYVLCFSNLKRAPVWGNTPVISRCLQHLYPFRRTASLQHYSLLFCILLVTYCTAVARTRAHTHARTHTFCTARHYGTSEFAEASLSFSPSSSKILCNAVRSCSWCSYSYSFPHKFWDILTHHEDKIEPCSVFMVVPSPVYQKAYPTAHNINLYGGTVDKACRPNVASYNS